MLLMNYAEFRSLTWFKKKNLVVSYSVDVDSDGERFYEIVAAEQTGNAMYYCKINSIEDPDCTLNFETRYMDLCNLPIVSEGMAQDVQALMLNYLSGIEQEMKLLNKRIEFMIERHISHEDVVDE